MATITKEFLSGGAANGRPIKVVAVGTPGTLLHTAHATAKDEVNIWLSNTDVVDRLVTIEFGGVTSPDDHLKVTVPSGDSVLAAPGIPLSGGLLVRAFAAAANVITAWGYVNRIA
jgi:hypothetical protein